jgi:hypothetical protein
MPADAGVITGAFTVCQGQTGIVYSVPAIANATTYVWSLPSGATITSGNNTRSITVSFSTSASSGNINVYGTNSCGNGTISSDYYITVNPLPEAAGSITGTSTINGTQSGIPYDISAVNYATSYVWNYTGSNVTINNSTTNNVTLDFPFNSTSGILSAIGQNACGTGTASPGYSITVIILPDPAGPITGTSVLCQGTSNVAYSVDPISNATSYIWSYSGIGASITGTSNSVTIDFAANATSGNLTVRGTNSYGDGTPSPAFAITVNVLPVAGTMYRLPNQ